MGEFLRSVLQSVFVFFLALSAFAQSDASVPASTSTKAQRESIELSDADEEWLEKTPLKTKVGQLFIFGFMGQDLERGLKKTLVNQKPGAIIVFGRNIKSAQQLIDLNYSAQKQAVASSGQPLLIAVDQEGGSVIRIRTSPPLPSALALGESKDPELVHRAGLHTGHLLKALGFNMNLAPVLDVADPKKDSFVGTRTFGNDPDVVSRMGSRFAVGLSEAGILPTAKHFPGHGGVADSHKVTPVKDSSLETLNRVDLVPFASGFKEIPESAVMMAHIAYPKLDPASLPATFSKPVITGLLREKMGFGGLVVTDDIEMAGAFAIKDPAERAVRAVEAGVDLVMIAWNKKLQASAVDAVTKAVRSGRMSEERIDESLRRILRIKRRVAAGAISDRPTVRRLQQILKSSELQKLTFDTLNRQFEKSVNKLPSKELVGDKARPVFVFAATDRFFATFKENIGSRRARFYRLSTVKTFDINKVMRANPSAVGVLHMSGIQSARFANIMDTDTASRMIIVNSETVSLLKAPTQFHHIIDVYFKHPDLGRITAEYFFAPPEAIKQAKRIAQKQREPAKAEADPSESETPEDE